MPNICVKYVNSQRLFRRITGDSTYTHCLYLFIQTTLSCLQSIFINLSTLFSYTPFSTSKNTINNLLNNSFTHNPQSLLIELIN